MTEESKQEIAATEDRAVAVTQSGTLLSAIVAASTNPDVDIDKMERIMQMHKDIRQEEARQAYFQAKSRAQSEMVPVIADAKNEQTKSKYARLKTINQMINPIITSHGFAMSFGTADCPKEGHYRVTCVVSHEGGFSENYIADVPSDASGIAGNRNKTETHAWSSSQTYGRRVLKCMIFDITVEDDDDGNAASKRNNVDPDISAAHHKTLLEKIEEVKEAVGFDEDVFFKAMKVSSTEELTESQFARAMSSMNKRLADANKGEAA